MISYVMRLEPKCMTVTVLFFIIATLDGFKVLWSAILDANKVP